MEGLLRNCTVIEGHFAFTNMFQRDANSTPVIPSFPELREITDFMLLYLGEQLKTLATVFPNLSVIRGNKLMKVLLGHNLVLPMKEAFSELVP